MDFAFDARTEELRGQLQAFIDEHILPAEEIFEEQAAKLAAQGRGWERPPVMDELKAKARHRGLWNLFLAHHPEGAGLTNLQYAPLAELSGRSFLTPEALNCAAPDTGNMEVLAEFGTKEQQDRWLRPLLDGEIRSAFCMTEPAVASSDATNISTSITRDGDEYVINGRKWWSSGAMDPRCRILIVMGKTNPDADRHRQQSQILVPKDTPGVSLGTRIIDCCRCRSAPGSVLPMTIRIWQRGSIAPDDHHLRPLITYSLPSRSILVAMLVASDEATSGSVMQNADRISPSSSGRSQRCCCSAEPNSVSSSMLPVSGAAQFSASGAIVGLCPVISASGAYCRLDRPAPSG